MGGHNQDSREFTQNPNNEMSDDPGDDSRNPDPVGPDGKTPVEKAPPHEAEDQSTLEAFDEEGAGIAPKE